MSNIHAIDSVGIVTPKSHHFKQRIDLDCGKHLNEFKLVYETYGNPNKAHSNAILICHALSGDHHAAGYYSESNKKPGWWDTMIGPGKPIDTNLFYVVSVNNLGGCRGSSGPTSINPATNKLFGPDFPNISVHDWVLSQHALMQALNIPKWLAVVGGSLGGMQALQWAIDFPDKLEHAILIASTSKLSAQNIAFNEIARQAILSDPDFHNGYYYEHNTMPKRGLMLARMLGHITYQSDEAMGNKFGREVYENNSADGAEFQVERYLRYQGESFVNRFDANTYLLMTKALDYFDPASDYDNNLAAALSQVQCKFLVISFTSDWRFSPRHSWEIVKALLDCNKNVSYAEINATQGHDAFLLKNDDYMNIMSSYLKKAQQAIV